MLETVTELRATVPSAAQPVAGSTPAPSKELEQLRKENAELRVALAQAQAEANELHDKLQVATTMFLQRKPMQ